MRWPNLMRDQVVPCDTLARLLVTRMHRKMNQLLLPFLAGRLVPLVALALMTATPGAATPADDNDSARATTIIVVRHAEKEIDDSRDPALSQTGLQRAQALAEVLEHAGLDAIYASQYQRTRLTATPAAEAAGLAVRTEQIEGDIKVWAQHFSANLLREHPGQTILVAGHSNTVPPLVAALCRCEVEPLAEDDYDRLFIVNRADGNEPSLIAARYGAG